VDFLFVLIELFSLGVTTEALGVNIDMEIGVFEEGWSVRPNFHVVTSPSNHCTDM